MRRFTFVAIALFLSSCSSTESAIDGPATMIIPSTGGGEPVTTTSSDATSTAVPLEETSTTTNCDHPTATVTNHVYARYPGVDDRFTSFDLHLPAGCGPFQVLVWVHGGAWTGGDKANPESEDRARFAESYGYALVSTNYRLANKYGHGQWPDYPGDVADAIAHIVAESDVLRLDASRITLLGHSAGAHTVAVLVTDPAFLADRGLTPQTIDCVIANDTEGYRLDDESTAYPEAVNNAFGTDPAVLADASPTVQVERHGAPAARMLVITRGSVRRRDMAREFVETILASHGRAELFIAGDYSHSEVNKALGEPGELVVTPKVGEFLTECLVPID